ncbi:MAG TPA: MFS transporter [Clostridia bacterium]|nr:MFS transporter [Clostridia bacterium]
MVGARLRGQLRETGNILKGFKGNARACIMMEPLWGIPYNLFITYASVYMIALGSTEKQIGLIASVGLIFQMFFSLVGGHITDKLGRKRTSLVFAIISWTIPTLIWAMAQNFYYFLIAAIINSAVRVVHTSWTCLFVEDTPPEGRVHVFTWTQIAGILSGFVAPVAGILVSRYQLVPAVRGLYFFAFFSMTSMFIIRNYLVHETGQGLIRMKESKNVGLFDSLEDYKRAATQLISTPYTMIVFLLSIFSNIHTVIRTNFFAILLTKKLQFSQGSIALFPMIQSGIMLLVLLFVMPALGRISLKKPLLGSFASLIISNLLLVVSPHKNYFVLIISTVFMAFGTAVSFPLIESMLANAIDDKERAKTMSILYVILFAVTAPFGYIGGVLASVSEELPFVMMGIIFVICIFLIFILDRLEKPGDVHDN